MSEGSFPASVVPIVTFCHCDNRPNEQGVVSQLANPPLAYPKMIFAPATVVIFITFSCDSRHCFIKLLPHRLLSVGEWGFATMADETFNRSGARMMKISLRRFALLTALAVVVPVSAGAQDAAAIYKSKCSGCHGADGKKVATADLSSAAVQKKSDADLAGVITNGKPPKMPKYASLSADQVSGLVAYIRTLK